MKKIFSFLFMSAMLLVMGASVASCSSDGDDDGTISERRMENYVAGYKWYLDNNKRSEFRFYRNRLVTCMSSGKVTSGSLTYAESNFFGTWAVVDGKLVTTFTSGAYEGFDWNDILYGSLTITKLRTNTKTIEATAPNGDSHALDSYASYGSSNTFEDFTDASDHDGALIGTWETTGYKGGQGVAFTIKIGKKGKITFSAPSENINFTTECTTKNGHVVFDHIFTPESNSCSLIYIREKETIRFYDEKNAQTLWVWQKK